tara:strand:- start:424 stop:789 length:366 start_codon:yes stop_codon:yes gene_type:complete
MFLDNDLQIIFVGNGNQLFIQGFKNRMQVASPVYTDPELSLYEAINANKGISTTIHPRAVWHYLVAILEKNSGGGLKGDAVQQGGALIINPKNQKMVIYTSGVAGDKLNVQKIIQQAEIIK